jgi:sucrose phosphorylase
MRPVIGILTDDEINELVNLVKKRGGFVSYATTSEGKREPYELNITYYDAITDSTDDEELNIKKFIASQSILLSFIGIPGIYVHSLFGTNNYSEGVENTEQKRTINRKKFEFSDLEKELSCKNTKSYKIFTALKELIKKRRKEEAFNPNGDQKVLSLSRGIFSFIRTSPDCQEKIIVLTNITNKRQEFFISEKECGLNNRKLIDIISENSVNIENKITLEPYQIMWLKNQNNKK